MQGLIGTHTCHAVALAVVGELENIASNKKGDLEWITSEDAKTFLKGTYKPSHAIGFLEHIENFSADMIYADQSIVAFDGYTYWLANFHAVMDGMTQRFVLVFDAGQYLLAIMSVKDFADEFRVLVSGA